MQHWLDRAAADPGARSLLEDLRRRLRGWLLGEADAGTLAPHAPLVRQLGEERGAEVEAVLFYGSCLLSRTRSATSFPDFYVLVRSLTGYHARLRDAALNAILPPNVYYRALAGSGSKDPSLRCKVCVMSSGQFVRETSPRARDLHHLGRFSKRFALAYSAHEGATRIVVDGALGAMLTLVPHSLALLPPTFTLEELLHTQLSLSYLGEKRVAEPDKVEGLIEGARGFYLEIYPRVLKLHAELAGTPRLLPSGRYAGLCPGPRQEASTRRLLARSRRRGMLRWPKYILTVESWVQYMLDKLARHHGVQVELTPLQARFPLIFAWPVYFDLRRRGLVR